MAADIGGDPFTRELNWLNRCFQAEVLPAVTDAVLFCERRNIPKPSWLRAAELKLVVAAVNGPPRRKGRGGNYLSRLRQDLIHSIRYDMVDELRQYQRDIAKSIAETEEVAPNLPELKFQRKILNRIGRSWDSAFRSASWLLRKSPAFGSPETMKASYRQIVASGADPKLCGRFHTLSRPVYIALGMGDLLDQPRGNILDLLFTKT